MNYNLMLYLATSAIMGVSLGVLMNDGKYKGAIALVLIQLIAYILIIAKFN